MLKAKSKRDIEEAFNKIDETFERLTGSKSLKEARIEPFHESFPLAKNGICAMIAPMGAGKSYTYSKLCAKQEVIKSDGPIFETIVICSTSAEFDKTVQTFTALLKRSKLIMVKDDELLNFLDKYSKRMLKYSAMMDYLDNNFTKPSIVMEEIIKKHGLGSRKKQLAHISKKMAKYGWSSHPHRMLLILDDFASHPLIKSRDAPLSRMLKKLRHYYINVIICVQTVKSIPKDIKRCLADVMLFPGISREDFDDLLKEVPLGTLDAGSLTRSYYALKNDHDLFAVYLKAKRIVVTQARR